MTTADTIKSRGGRPPASPGARRVNVPLRLPEYLVAWIDAQGGTRTSVIEAALVDLLSASLSADRDAADYAQRARPRLAQLDALSARIDFASSFWRETPDGARYQRLMDEQARDEQAAGL